MTPFRFPRSTVMRVFIIGTAALALVTVVAVLASRDLRFVLRSAYEEAKILLRRRPLGEVIADPNTNRELREALTLVRDARTFGRQIGLDVGDTYTTYTKLETDTLLLVVSASPKTRLEFYTWRYPIVGTVPYKGFFDHEAALREAGGLADRGYDVHVRPAGAFSTLGWFNDPVLSTVLSRDPALIVATVIHEIVHNTLYLKGETPFNETLASFVGYHGARSFFEERDDSLAARRVMQIWRDENRLRTFYGSLRERLDSLYSTTLPDSAKLVKRQTIFEEARRDLAGGLEGALEIYNANSLAERQLNNATVLAAGIYRTGVEEFARVLDVCAGNLEAMITSIAELFRHWEGGGEGRSPFDLLGDIDECGV